MTQSFSPNVGLPYIDTNAQKHVIANAAFEKLDALVMLAAANRTLTSAPTSPVDGARHLVPAGGWASHPGKQNQIAHFTGGAWTFYPPQPGWLCFVQNEARLLAFDSADWIHAANNVSELQNLTRLGVGTAADATNVFAAKLANVLWTAKPVAEGGSGDLRAKLSKETDSNVLSLVFQTNYSGRAEFGLTGDDDFHVKVSADGTAWVDAFWIARATGTVTFSTGLAVASSNNSILGTTTTGTLGLAAHPSGHGNGGSVLLRANGGVEVYQSANRMVAVGAATVALERTTAATSTTTGALTVSGGVGIAGRLYMGDRVVLPNAVALRSFDNVGSERNLLLLGGNNITVLEGGAAGMSLRTNNGAVTALVINNVGAVRLNTYGAGSLVTDASGNVTASSDERLKTVNAPFERTVRDLMDHDAGRPVRFHWREDSGLDPSGEYVGFLAQDYGRGVPEAVSIDPRGYRTFSDRTAIAVLHNTAFDHEERLDALTRSVADLAARVVEIESSQQEKA